MVLGIISPLRFSIRSTVEILGNVQLEYLSYGNADLQRARRFAIR